jgi:hypothetical protein
MDIFLEEMTKKRLHDDHILSNKFRKIRFIKK